MCLQSRGQVPLLVPSDFPAPGWLSFSQKGRGAGITGVFLAKASEGVFWPQRMRGPPAEAKGGHRGASGARPSRPRACRPHWASCRPGGRLYGASVAGHGVRRDPRGSLVRVQSPWQDPGSSPNDLIFRVIVKDFDGCHRGWRRRRAVPARVRSARSTCLWRLRRGRLHGRRVLQHRGFLKVCF